MKSSLQTVTENVAACDLDGNRFVWVSLSHPSHGKCPRQNNGRAPESRSTAIAPLNESDLSNARR